MNSLTKLNEAHPQDVFWDMYDHVRAQHDAIKGGFDAVATATKEQYKSITHIYHQFWPSNRSVDWYTYCENGGFTLSGSKSPSKISKSLKKNLDDNLKRLSVFGKSVKRFELAKAGQDENIFNDMIKTFEVWVKLEQVHEKWHSKLGKEGQSILYDGWQRGLNSPDEDEDNLDRYAESWPDMPKLVDLALLKM